MINATAKDMRFHTSALLNSVARGEEVTITYRGTAKAKLVPLSVDRPAEAVATEAFGMWQDRTDIGNPSEYVRKIRRGRF